MNFSPFRCVVASLLGALTISGSASGVVPLPTVSYQWTQFIGLTTGAGTAAQLNSPAGLAVDAAGAVYIADRGSNTIRKLSGGVVTVLAGSFNVSGNADGTGTSATFNLGAQSATIRGVGLTVDTSGNVYVADNQTIRLISSTGAVVTIAGQAGTAGFNDDVGLQAQFADPWGLLVDKDGGVLVADYSNNCIRKVATDATVTTFAGKPGAGGILDAQASAALFQNPSGLVFDQAGRIFISDTKNHSIRVYDLDTNVSTLAGNGNIVVTGFMDGFGIGAQFNDVVAIAYNPAGAGNAFVSDPLNSKIRTVSFVGNVDSLAPAMSPEALASPDEHTVYATDAAANIVRQVTDAGVMTPFIGARSNSGLTNGTGIKAGLNLPGGLAVDASGNIYIADTGNNQIRKTTSAGVVTTLAGSATGLPGSANGTGAAARFKSPAGVAVDSLGTVYVADTGNHTIRAITSAGVVSTLAGTAGQAGSVDDTGVAAKFSSPSAVVVSGGVVYVADTGNHTIRAVTLGGVVTTLAGSAGTSGTTDDTGTAALFNKPSGLAADSMGNLIVADTGNHTIRMVTTAGVVTTIAGTAGTAGFTDGTGTAAKFDTPMAVTVDSDDNVYVVDAGDDIVRLMTPARAVTTIGGASHVEGARDGVGAVAVFTNPSGIVWSKSGRLYVADRNNNRLSVGNTTSPHLVVQRPDSSVLAAGANTVAFGTLAALSSTTYTLTLSDDIGSGTLTNLAVSIDGANSADFSVANTPPTTVLAGKSTPLVIAFKPLDSGSRTATLHITSNDPLHPSFDIGLTGTGVPGVAFLSAVTFVNEEVGTVQIPVIRTGGTSGTVTVTVNSAPGTATAADYTPVVDFVVKFGDTEGTGNVPVMITPDLLNEPNQDFTLTLSSPTGGIILGTPSVTTIRIVDINDSKKPTVTITAPTAGFNAPEGNVTVTGTAADDKGVAKVQVSINGGPYSDASAVLAPSGLTATYRATITPVAGPNIIAVKSIDTRNNESVVVTRAFNSIWVRPLNVNIAGSGSVTKTYLGASNRNVGFKYTIVATPAAGQVFNGWTANNTSGTGITPALAELPSLTFTHQQGLVLTANFILNPFTTSVIGNFNGLALPSDTDPVPTHTPTNNDTLGFFNASVTNTGSFTSVLKMVGQSFTIKGVFDNLGVARFGTTRATSIMLAPTGNLPFIELALHLDLSGATDKIKGTATRRKRDGSITAVSNIDADRAHYSALTKVSSTFAGTASKTYTLAFLHRSTQASGLTTADYPQGDGYATGTVKTDGTVSFAGKLADNTAITVSAPLSKGDQWPLYAQLYSLKGTVAGMVHLVAKTDTDMDMDSASGLLWTRPFQSVQWYPFGWPEVISTDVVGAVYNAATLNADLLLPVPNLTIGNATLTFVDGGLTGTVVKNVSISTTHAMTKAPATDATFTASLTAATGLINGTFTHTTTSKSTIWQGVIFQKGAHRAGKGYFMTVSPPVVDGNGISGGVKLDHK